MSVLSAWNGKIFLFVGSELVKGSLLFLCDSKVHACERCIEII